MKNQFSRLEISDYRTLLKHHAKSDIVKIAATGSDLPATTAQIRRDMVSIISPAVVLVSVTVPLSENVEPGDLVELLTVAVGNRDNAPTVIWGVKKITERQDVKVIIYIAKSLFKEKHPTLHSWV
ncbi:MAG: hypothetical protein NC548_29070 [Lachnospiraceae bacterium]|nr:hypothetical protein [Lachnospiraceae bacterium]